MCPAKFELCPAILLTEVGMYAIVKICDIVSRTVITLSSQDEMSSHLL